ncbi:MAG: hypothetical protein J6X89_02850 [Bacteroidales bacterium]|nr:hypothetical protein [Bacteroidales bacterium]
MGESVIIFAVWLAIVVLGVVVSIKKKAKQQQNAAPGFPGKVSLDDILSKLQNEAPRTTAADEAREEVRSAAAGYTMAEEGISSTAKPEPEPEPKAKKAATTAAPQPEKEQGMDFDPVDMVIYSEIMKPGYEKY